MKTFQREQDRSVERTAELLDKGSVVVVPTDTLYGFTARIDSHTAYQSVLQLKRSTTGRQFLYVADELDTVERYIAGWGCTTRMEMGRVWPAPLSGVFRAGQECPEWAGDTVAFRVPNDAWLCAVIRRVGVPLLSTSVNEGGGPPIGDARCIEKVFGDGVSLIVTVDEPVQSLPSTLVDFTGAAPVVIRAGRYAWAARGKPSK